MAGSGEGLGPEQDVSKSAFMEIQQQQMNASMNPYAIRGGYPGNAGQMEGFPGQQTRGHIGYPFSMTPMGSHGTYNPTSYHHFSAPGYQTSAPSVTPPTSRESMYDLPSKYLS